MKNKEETKRKILQAVGEIVISDGFKALKIGTIAKKAGVDRNLIYRYFGKDVKTLIEAYIVEKDYYLKFAEQINQEVIKNSHPTTKDLIIDILQNQWRYFSGDREIQELILWELSGNSELMKSIHNTRELMAQPIIEMAENYFIDSTIKFKPIAVMLLSGIYYANIHAIYNGNFMCGMDVKSEEGQKELMQAIEQILEWAFEKSKKI